MFMKLDTFYTKNIWKIINKKGELPMDNTKKDAVLAFKLTDQIKADLEKDVVEANNLSHHWTTQMDGTDLLKTYYPDQAQYGTPLMADVLALHLIGWLTSQGVHATPRRMNLRTRISLSAQPLDEKPEWSVEWFAQRNQVTLGDDAKEIAEQILKSYEEEIDDMGSIKTKQVSASGEIKEFKTVESIMPFSISVHNDGYEGDDAITDFIIESEDGNVLSNVVVEDEEGTAFFSQPEKLKIMTTGSIERAELANMLRWVADELEAKKGDAN